MKKVVLRTYSASREDLFNIKVKELPEYSVLYKMLFDSEDMLNEYTRERTTGTREDFDELDKNEKA